MIELMTKQFAKWAAKQKIPANELAVAIAEMQKDGFEANLVVIYTRKEFVLLVKAKVATDVPLFATSETTEPYSYTALQKTKKATYPKRNFMPSKNFQKFS